MCWTGYYDIDIAMDNNGPLAGRKGVYKIRAIDKEGKPLQIGRLFGIDKRGILYIGKTKRQGIAARIRLNVNNELGIAGIRDRLPKLQARARFLEDGQDEAERELLDTYKQRHGELPPINRSHPR